MADYIKREDALNELCKYCVRNGSCAVKCAEFENVQSIPAADVRPVVHARWKGDGFGDYRCSWCDEVVNGKPHFCPYCGVMMDLEG